MKKVAMKKFFALSCVACFLCVCLAGCGKNVVELVQNNMSEQTEVYYLGESEKMYCTLSAGTREEQYAMDGKHGKCVIFALLCINLPQQTEKCIEIVLDLNGLVSTQELQLNTLNDTYMLDLETKITGSEQISITYAGETLQLENVSNNFAVGWQKAIEIACTQLEDKILLKEKNGDLGGECYLRILDKKANNFTEIFWCFSIFNVAGENYSAVISTENGKILAKS